MIDDAANLCFNAKVVTQPKVLATKTALNRTFLEK